jgi:hypothetical protein
MTTRLAVTGDVTDLDTITAALIDTWRSLGKPAAPLLVIPAHPTGTAAVAEQLWQLWGWPRERATTPGRLDRRIHLTAGQVAA